MKCDEKIKQYELCVGDLVGFHQYIPNSPFFETFINMGIVINKKVLKSKKIIYQIYWNHTKTITSINQIQIIEKMIRKIVE